LEWIKDEMNTGRGKDRDAKSEEHEERAPAIFPPALLIFGLPTQKNMLKYAKIC
jgi:hypothetical protein